MKLEVPAASYEEISQAIVSTDSPVGIDAKKTHVMILYKLEQIERRLGELEAKLARP